MGERTYLDGPSDGGAGFSSILGRPQSKKFKKSGYAKEKKFSPGRPGGGKRYRLENPGRKQTDKGAGFQEMVGP